MRKLALWTAASFLAATGFPVMAQNSARGTDQDIGGHFRHMHRDWSQQEGRHVHNVCWEWNPGVGWVWKCKN
jgi:hypothetical protein